MTDRQSIAEQILISLNDNVKRTCDENLFDIYKQRILQMLDTIDSPQFDYKYSIYDVVEGCNREEISTFISTSNSASVNSCIGEMQVHIEELL